MVKAFLDDTAQIIGPKFYFDQAVQGRSERERAIGRFVLDKAKQVYDAGQKIGGVRPLGFFHANLEHYVYTKKYSKSMEGSDKEKIAEKIANHKMPADASEREAALREALVEFGNKLVSEDLVQGSWGNLSARLDEHTMLVTPSGIDYGDLHPADMVRVNIDTLEYGEDELKPTSEKGLHASIYKNRKDVNAIIHTHSTYCSVYAACEKDLPLKGAVAEVFGPVVRVAGYGFAGTKKLADNTARAVGSGMGAIMSHHGMITCGSDLPNAFENCCMLENAAKESLR